VNVRILRSAALLALSLASAAAASAQQPAAPPPPPAAAEADSSTVSARGALIRSLILPGWGQSYVGAPGRGAIYFALEAGSLWMTYKTAQSLRTARELESWLRETGQLPEDDRLAIAESREEQREDWIALSLFWILASGADAYVSAQLADFSERVGVRPTPSGGLELEARFPVGVHQ
jgi:hypothetical protein